MGIISKYSAKYKVILNQSTNFKESIEESISTFTPERVGNLYCLFMSQLQYGAIPGAKFHLSS